MEIKNYEVPDDLDMEQDAPNLHADPSYQPPWAKKKRGGKKILITFIIILLLAALGAGGYALLHKSKPPIKQDTHQSQNQDTPPPANNTASGTSQYTSPANGLNLSFTYPSAWTVSPPSGQGGNAITITSPLVSLTDAKGAAVTGKVVVSIRGDTSNISELNNTTATAGQDSEQYAYSAPTVAQHQYFYVSFLHFQGASISTAGAFEEVAITGINQIAKSTPITGDTLGNVDPLITAAFFKCTTSACTGAGRSLLSVNNSVWQNDATMKQAIALFESLKLN